MIYLDNAATSFPKPKSVIEATEKCIKKYCANSGRSSHKLAMITSREIYKTREAISDFLFFDYPENICFTLNATYALNIAIKSIITENCHVLISDLEHNSVLRPINKLKVSIGITYSYFSTDGDIKKNIQKLITNKTKAIVSTLMSNVNGKEIPLSILSDVAKENGLSLIVDASQVIGHKEINLKNIYFDALCAPAHKGLLGIQGCGFVVFGKKISNTIIEGGSGNDSLNLKMPSDLPEHFEAGTLPSPSIISLQAGIEYIKEFGLENIELHNKKLSILFYEMLSEIKNTEIYSAENGIISFRFKGIDSNIIANKLNEYGIFVRSGLHCAPMAHRKLGTLDTGLVRISTSVFNKSEDCIFVRDALKEISNTLFK